MSIKYNENNQSLEINDGLKYQHMLVYFAMVLNLFNAITQLTKRSMSAYRQLDYFWIVIAVISIIAMLLFYFKQSFAKEIPVHKIKRLKTKKVFGKKRYALVLTNGKNRNIISCKTDAEVSQFLGLLENIGIPT